MTKLCSVQELDGLRSRLSAKKDPRRRVIAVCAVPGCGAYGSEKVPPALREELKKRGLEDKVEVIATGCQGFCEKGPITVIRPENILYTSVKPEDAAEIVEETVVHDRVVERLLYKDPVTGERAVHENDIPFYKHQTRNIFGRNGLIDPNSIEDYIAIGGYAALAKALTKMTPESVIAEVKKSGLRGRGGAGFSTGQKWEFARKAVSPDGAKYVIVNGDEGDPGAYMDRSLLEGNPHSVIEGLMIGAFAIGACEGYLYVRTEYPLAVKRLYIALAQAEEYGLLGKNILGTGFDFTIRIFRGAGAFVCGEETALLASLESRVGEPRGKPPFPAQSGLWGRPTNINNVKTWANIAPIIANGADWFSSIGTKSSKGTMIFSLVGKINNSGLVEVPMGITLRRMIFDIGGGIPRGKKFKAVQMGGPSGGCVPESLLDLPIDYDQLTAAGAMMGSGGMIVMDETTCMVDIAKYFQNFLKDESCGKCTPCRVGIAQMHAILTDITEGRGKEGDIEALEELSDVVKNASLCLLGGTAPNPVLTTIRYFRNEYEAHIRDKKCPAHVCKKLITYKIDAEKCKACGACLKACPARAVSGEKKVAHVIDPARCIRCGACFDACKFDAVELL